MSTVHAPVESIECALARNRSTLSGDAHAPPTSRPTGAKAQLGIFIAVVTLSVLFVVVFVVMKFCGGERYSRLRKRRLEFVIITHLGCCMASATGSWFDSHSLETGVPCWLYYPLFYLSVPCLIFPQALQLFAFWRGAQYTEAAKSIIAMEQRNTDALSETSKPSAGQVLRRIWGVQTLAYLAVKYPRMMRRKTGAAIAAASSSGAEEDRADSSSVVKGAAREEALLVAGMRILQFFRSDRGAFIVLLGLFTPFLLTMAISMAVSEMVRLGCWGCFPDLVHSIIIIIEGIVAISIIVFAYRLSLKREDPFGFVQEARIGVWLGGFPACICLILNLVYGNKHDFKFVMLMEIFVLIYCGSQSLLQCILAAKDHLAEKGALSSYLMSIEEFDRELLRPDGHYHSAFSEHLIHEHAHENLAFILSTRAWEKGFYDNNAKTNRVRAKKIISMHVGDDALLPVNLPSIIVNRIKNDFNSDGDLSADLFNGARSEIETLLYRDGLIRFMRTKVFAQLFEKRQAQALTQAPV